MRDGAHGRTAALAPVLLPLLFCLALPALTARTAAAAEPATATTLLSSINVRATSSTVCHRVEEVNAALFPGQQVIGYDFAGAEAAQLSQAMREDVEAAPEAALVRVILILGNYEAIAFQFGSDGCHLMTADFAIEEMEAAFQRAGLLPPFGQTFSRMLDRVIWTGPIAK
jgi:hypothetical protein